jgi:tetratricopeptide (TPR) repeat protein
MKFVPTLLVIAFTAIPGFNQDPTQRITQPQQTAASADVDLELKQVAALYKAGKFAEAQAHAERAVLLAPSYVTAAVFLARVRHQRYRPGNETPANLEMARAAIAAYQNVLSLDPQHEEAYKAIAVLYASTHQDELLRAWVLQRAMNPQVANEKRAEAYAVLAGKDWDCSYKFTELPNHKITDANNSKVTYKLPAEDAVEFQKIKQCVTNGLEMSDAAILLDNESESAWSYKTNLFLEAAKLAEMEGLDFEKPDFEKQAKEAGAQAIRISEKRRRADGSVDGSLEILPRPLPPPPAPKPTPNSLL